MPVIVVANPKGGVGKSTLATNLAGCLARAGHAVMLGDVDRQQSARQWLALRPAALPADPRPGTSAHDRSSRPPKGTTHVVLDTPAGLHGRRFDDVMKHRRPRDRAAAAQPVRHPGHARLRGRAGRSTAGRQGRRSAWSACGCDERTIAADQLRQFVDGLGVPVLAMLRDTQIYVQLAARGADAVGRGAEPGRDATWRSGSIAAARRGCAHDDEALSPHLADLAAAWSARRSPTATGSPIDQERIDRFAEATGDHQWIHVDPERAAAGPFGATIAHGFLTLSLLPHAVRHGAFEIDDVRMGVNYGLNRVRFPAPVPVGSRVRGRLKLLAFEPIDGGAQLTIEATIEREGNAKPVCVAERCRAYVDTRLTLRHRSMKVLLVDDHPLILAALQAVIRGLGDDVTVVGVRQRARRPRGAEARPRLRPGAARPAARRRATASTCWPSCARALPGAADRGRLGSDRASDVIRAIDAGAMGFVPKRASNDTLSRRCAWS